MVDKDANNALLPAFSYPGRMLSCGSASIENQKVKSL